MKKEIKVLISWSGDNYCAGTGEVNGVVMATSRHFDTLKKEFEETFSFHLEEEDALENYVLNYELQTSALLKKIDGILTRSALSRITGINQQQLSHYLSGYRNPRPKQREKIIQGIQHIANELKTVV